MRNVRRELDGGEGAGRQRRRGRDGLPLVPSALVAEIEEEAGHQDRTQATWGPRNGENAIATKEAANRTYVTMTSFKRLEPILVT